MDSQKYLGLVIDSTLNFNEHIESKITKCNKVTVLMKKKYKCLSWKSLLTTYKYFVTPNFDYGDIIYGKPLNECFKKKNELVQYNAALMVLLRGLAP